MNNAGTGAAGRLSFLRRLKRAAPIGVLASLTFGAIDPASAQDDRLIDRYTAEYTAGHLEKDAKPDPLRSGPLFAVVSIADQRISVYGSGGLLARARVSTGVRGHATPTGVFSIVQKQRWHESNIYSGAPMPLMQRITWSGIALHEGVVPGHPASHGCIRLPGSFAQRLFGATEIGQRVIVAPSDATPVEITHANLPVPMLSPAPGVAASGALDAPDATASVSTPRQNGDPVLEPASLQDAPAIAGRLNPIEFARAMKSEASGRVREAGRATRAAMLLIAKKTTELRMATRKLAAAENAAEEAVREVASAARHLEKTDGKEAIAEAAEGKSEAEAALIEAQKTKDARIAKATEAQTQTEAALNEAQKARDARIATVTDARTQAEVGLNEAQKAAEQGRVARAAVAETQAGTDTAEAQKAEEARVAQASEAKNDADAALTKAQKEEDARVAKASEIKTKAEAALAEAQKAEELRVAKATEAKTEAEAALTEAQTDEEARIAKATAAKAAAEAAVVETQKAAADARAVKDAKQQELAATRSLVVEAKAAGKAAAKSVAEASRRMRPLSVFISRKTGRLYVRQNFEPLFDVPVSIRDADREIGTHVYVSTHAAEDGSALRWLAVSMPAAEPMSVRRDRKGRGDPQDNASTSASAYLPEPETAHGALDRVTIPEDTSRRLAELAWVGASIIISDYGISGETDSSTDFIILTRSRASTR